MTVNFMYNGIKIGGKLYKANYRFSGYTPGNGLAGTTITMYGCYRKMPEIDGLTIIENKKDSMTNRVRIAENDQYYNEAKKGLILHLQYLVELLEKNIAGGKKYGLQTMDILNEYKRILSVECSADVKSGKTTKNKKPETEAQKPARAYRKQDLAEKSYDRRRREKMQNYEVRFFNPMCPGEIGSFLVKARNAVEAVFEATFCLSSDFHVRYDKQDLLVRETKMSELKTAQHWSTENYTTVNAPVSGYKMVVKKTA